MTASVHQVFPLKINRKKLSLLSLYVIVAVGLAFFVPDSRAQANASGPDKPLLIQRSVRSWEFLCAVGKRAGIFGNESGRFDPPALLNLRTLEVVS